jgi:hypothetical protein
MFIIIKMINQWSNDKELICEYKNDTIGLCLKNGKDILEIFNINPVNK